jgi:hypothetical protein
MNVVDSTVAVVRYAEDESRIDLLPTAIRFAIFYYRPFERHHKVMAQHELFPGPS